MKKGTISFQMYEALDIALALGEHQSDILREAVDSGNPSEVQRALLEAQHIERVHDGLIYGLGRPASAPLPSIPASEADNVRQWLADEASRKAKEKADAKEAFDESLEKLVRQVACLGLSDGDHAIGGDGGRLARAALKAIDKAEKSRAGLENGKKEEEPER